MNSTSASHFPEKVYLSGADCFFLMLEENAKKHQIGNNVIRICLYFNEKKEADFLLKSIEQSPLIHWLCNIELVKEHFYNKPYWKYTNKGKSIPFKTQLVELEKTIPKELLNRGIQLGNNSMIECDSLNYPSGAVAVVLSWHHILMDGRGSGMLIRHLVGQIPFNEETYADFFPSKEKKVSVYHYVRNMYKVKSFVQRSSRSPIASIVKNCKATGKDNTFGLRTISFSEEETKLIDLNATTNGARFGANNFLIAACAHAIYSVNMKRGNIGAVWVPIPYDGRKRGGIGPIVTNCISFLFYRFEKEHFNSVSATIKTINEQMAEQLKIEMPRKYNLLLDMMRHIPLGLYSFLTSYSSKGAVSSFLFSSAGEGKWDMNNLMEHPFSDILIIPPFTFPPGITFSFLRNDNCLKMNIIYSEKCVDENELEFIESLLCSRLVDYRS